MELGGSVISALLAYFLFKKSVYHMTLRLRVK